ncbi:hypothetical protein M0R45_027155 [Rubus argutus]|uniref:Rhamnogalacturonan lyase domain-containing protein n=1 Tax=Rubus argutus TaxID=59490 RepID=A0AAW1WZM8_RUBAR
MRTVIIVINDIREVDYMLYALVPGFIGDYQYDVTINITTGYIDIGDIVYEPPGVDQHWGKLVSLIVLPLNSIFLILIQSSSINYMSIILTGLCSMVYGKYQGPKWQIKFGLDNVNQTKTYTLQIALATATVTELPIHVNDSRADSPLDSYMCGYIRLEGPSSSTST